jgi:hypothetical protein
MPVNYIYKKIRGLLHVPNLKEIPFNLKLLFLSIKKGAL